MVVRVRLRHTLLRALGMELVPSPAGGATMRALIIDFETTGLTLHPDAKPELQPRAIEFAGVLINGDGTVISEDSFLINPGVPISDEITKITGIVNADLITAPAFAEVAPRIAKLMAEADALIAHNLPFDRAILQHELMLAALAADWRWPAQQYCTVQLYEPMWGRRPRLIELYESVMGKPYEQTHRALDDVRALAEIIVKDGVLDLFNTAA